MKLFELILLSNTLLAFSSTQKNSTIEICTDMNFKYMIDGKICSEACPSQFIEESSPFAKCNLPVSPKLFELNFWKAQDLSASFIQSSSNYTDKWVNPLGVPYSSLTKNSPLPTLDRGFYFEPSSSIMSNKSYIPSLYFTLNFWIHQISPGILIIVDINSKNYIECILDSGISFKIISKNSGNYNESHLSIKHSNTLSLWNYLSFQIEQIACDSVKLQIFTKMSSMISQLFFGQEANFPNGNYTWTIGNQGNSFQGFLYWAEARNDLTLNYWEMSTQIQCLNLQYWDGNQCQDCDLSCSQKWPWCIRRNCSSICHSIDCLVCTGYASDMCMEHKIRSLPSCDWLADTCDSTWYSNSCKVGYYFINGICLYGCPYGFGNCAPVATPVITADFTGEFKGIYDDILVTAASDSHYYFWNDRETYDPIPVKNRGLYFTNNYYLEAKINFSYEFTIEIWIYIYSGAYLQFKKENSVFFSTDARSFNIEMEDNTGSTFPSPTLSWTGGPNSLQWYYLCFSMAFDKDSGVSTFAWLQDLSADDSYLFASNIIFRPPEGGSLFLGSSDFNGFISFFQLWQVASSSFWRERFHHCDSGEDLDCLWDCNVNQYWDGTGCYGCPPCERMQGCVRDSCNICDSELCLKCSSFSPNSCTLCVANRSGSSCTCDSGFYEPPGQTICSPCYEGCSACSGSFYYQCTSCKPGYYYFSAAKTCLSDCPLGYAKLSNECLLTTQLFFSLNLNTLNGVVYDSASSIPVVTGLSEQFYPDYEEDDPIGAHLRGFYFNGISSVMRLPEYKTYISPKLKIGPVFTISIWLNIENENSAVISKNDISNSYSTVYAVYLISRKPAIQLLINNSILLYMCQNSLLTSEWSHIVFQVNIDMNWNTVVTCYANTNPDPLYTLGFGYFQDINFNAISLIGAQQISQDIVGNFFQGFLYEIKIYNVVYSVALLSQTSCSENCGVCPINGSCIPNCKINKFWKGPEYNKCSNCNSNCKNGCKDSQTSCSVCYSSLCDKCINYSATGCKTCKSNASLENSSCICSIGYVLDNSNSCISVPAGGYRGSDDLLYPCPNLCSTCESSLVCSSCVNHASVINNLCSCNDGYNGATTCTYVPFSVSLIVFSNDSLALHFSDHLQNTLSINDATISIETNPKFTWNLEKINETYYYIPMSIKDEIPQDAVANVTFLDLSKVKSVWNGILNSSTVCSPLNKYDPNPYILVVSEIASNIVTIVQSTVIGSIILSILNQNPSSLWGLLNCLQILTYLSLSGIDFSNKMIQFLSSLNSYNFFPNFFEYLIEEQEGSKAYKEARNFGYNTDLILLNQGDDFSIVIASIVLLPFIIYFTGCSYRFVGKKFKKILKACKYSFYIRFWIQSYLELTAAAGVGLVVWRSDNAAQITNIFVCVLLYFLSMLTSPAFLIFSYWNRDKIQKKKRIFNSLFSSFFYEFRTEKGLLCSLYYFVYFLRRFIYITNIVFLSDYPKTQVNLNIICSLMSIFYLLAYWPFKDRILQISNLLSEVLIGLVMCATSFYLFDVSSGIISVVENSIIFISLTVIGTQFSASAVIFSRNVYEILRHKFAEHRNKKVCVLPIKGV